MYCKYEGDNRESKGDEDHGGRKNNVNVRKNKKGKITIKTRFMMVDSG